MERSDFRNILYANSVILSLNTFKVKLKTKQNK